MALGEAEIVVRSVLGEMTMDGDRRLERERERERLRQGDRKEEREGLSERREKRKK